MREWTREWLEQGRAQGIEQGIEQGREEERALLCRQTARKFDAAAAETLATAIAGVSDPDRLARVGDWIIECATAKELLARVGGDGRSRRVTAPEGRKDVPPEIGHARRGTHRPESPARLDRHAEPQPDLVVARRSHACAARDPENSCATLCGYN